MSMLRFAANDKNLPVALTGTTFVAMTTICLVGEVTYLTVIKPMPWNEIVKDLVTAAVTCPSGYISMKYVGQELRKAIADIVAQQHPNVRPQYGALSKSHWLLSASGGIAASAAILAIHMFQDKGKYAPYLVQPMILSLAASGGCAFMGYKAMKKLLLDNHWVAPKKPPSKRPPNFPDVSNP